MDITAVRAEIGGLITGRQVYTSIPGDPQVPCVVVGLPDEFRPTEGTYGLLQVLLPVWAIGGKPFEAKSEANVMTIADEIMQALRAHPKGTSYKSLGVLNVDRIGTTPIGPNEFVAAAVNTVLLIQRTES